MINNCSIALSLYDWYNKVILISQKDADGVIATLEQLFAAMLTPWKLNDSALYHRMAPMTKDVDAEKCCLSF